MSIDRGRFRVVSNVVAGSTLKVGTQVTLTASTATKVVASTPDDLAVQGVTVQAAAGNGASIWVGLSNVDTTHGIELAAGQSVDFPIADPSTVYAYAVGSGLKINVVWV